jgi:16S rRNA processing protein RimM
VTAEVAPRDLVPQDLVPEDLVLMAVVTTAQGIKGWVRLKTFTEDDANLGEYDAWWVRHPSFQAPRLLEVEAFEVRPNGVVAKLAGIETRTAAEGLAKAEIFISKAELPALGDDEAYWVDMVGLAVVNPAGESLGTVESLFETPANDVLVVKDGEVERLIPAVDAIVLDIDWQARKMLVDWGLDY